MDYPHIQNVQIEKSKKNQSKAGHWRGGSSFAGTSGGAGGISLGMGSQSGFHLAICFQFLAFCEKTGSSLIVEGHHRM